MALGVGATLRHMRGGNLQRRFSLYILACGLPGVIIGASFILRVPDDVARVALGVLTIGLGIYSSLSPELGQHYLARNRDRRGLTIGGGIIFMIGVLNGSLTSGTGLLLTLWLVRWFGLDYKSAVAYTLVLVGLFWNASGAITLGVQGEIYWPWLPALLLGSLIGGYLGAHLAIIKGNMVIKRSYEIIALLIGLKLIIG